MHMPNMLSKTAFFVFIGALCYGYLIAYCRITDAKESSAR